MAETKINESLTATCGHHCGVTSSTDTRTEGHCNCRECHHGEAAVAGPVTRGLGATA